MTIMLDTVRPAGNIVSHVPAIRRFVKFVAAGAIMVAVVAIAASVKFAIFYPRFFH